MNDPSRVLLASQQRALAAAAGLVGRPRLHAGLALLGLACNPVSGGADTEAGTDASTVAPSTMSSTGSEAPTSSSVGDAGSTLVTDASTSLATSEAGSTSTGDVGSSSTGDEGSSSMGSSSTGSTSTGSSSTGEASTGEASTGEASTGEASTGDGLDDCIDPRTKEVDFVCCEAQNWEPQPQCTPWGPPAPPSAAGRLQRARAARRALV